MNFLLDFRERGQGGAVVPGHLIKLPQRTSGAPAIALLQSEAHITFLLHGFNVNRKDGIDGLLRLATHLPSVQAGAVVAVLWPGDHWVGAVSYPFENRDADDTAAELAKFIDEYIRSDTPLSFATHSLGARVAMGALSRLRDKGYSAEHVCLMAAAIDDYSLASPDDYRLAVEGVGRVAVLYSVEDEVLRFAYPLGDVLQSFVFFWRESFGLALGYHGPKPAAGGAHPVPSNVLHKEAPEHRNSDHGDYIPAPVPNPEQLSAARFADEVLAGHPNPRYR
jgi:hypothetical protein